jgi:hypothetical protein
VTVEIGNGGEAFQFIHQDTLSLDLPPVSLSLYCRMQGDISLLLDWSSVESTFVLCHLRKEA